MLTRLKIKNFKLFEDVDIELGNIVVFIGPNNTGKTSALQALTLWEVGVKRWLEKRGSGPVPNKRPGVTINRRDLISLPIPTANLLWRDLHVREGFRKENKTRTKNILIEIGVEGIHEGKQWECYLEFDYANEESFYCRPVRKTEDSRMQVPSHLENIHFAYLPPMSGLVSREDRLDMGSINVRIGEGRTAEVLRNLCWHILQSENGKERWNHIVEKVFKLFGNRLDDPYYIKERGEVVMAFQTPSDVKLDISASGRGQQQTLLLLTYMEINRGSVILIDEPDAHLEILRQRQIYQILSDHARETKSQIIAASHSEILLNEAATRDVVIGFIGIPHRIDNRGAQLSKSLSEIGYDQYILAEEVGWIIYLEGPTDLEIIKKFANILDHEASKYLDCPFPHYVANHPNKAKEHFYALREAKQDLKAIAIFDRLSNLPNDDPNIIVSATKSV